MEIRAIPLVKFIFSISNPSRKTCCYKPPPIPAPRFEPEPTPPPHSHPHPFGFSSCPVFLPRVFSGKKKKRSWISLCYPAAAGTRPRSPPGGQGGVVPGAATPTGFKQLGKVSYFSAIKVLYSFAIKVSYSFAIACSSLPSLMRSVYCVLGKYRNYSACP